MSSRVSPGTMASRANAAPTRLLQSSGGGTEAAKRGSGTPVDLSEVHELELPSMIDDLAKQQAEFEAQGNFKEAEEIRRTLENFQEAEAERRREEMRSQMIAERLGVEEAHMQELREFHESWDTKDAEFEKHVSHLQQSLQQRHEQAHRQYTDKIQREVDPTPKWGKELLNLRKIQETLGKQKNYVEAGKIKDDADKIERKEKAVWESKREVKLATLTEQFVHKQQMEMGGLIERIDTNRKEHKQARKKELERILQRYDNVKKQMERQQKITTQKIEQYHLDRGSEWDTMSISAASSRPSMLGTQGASRLGSRLGLATGGRAPSELSDPPPASDGPSSRRQMAYDDFNPPSARQSASGSSASARRQAGGNDGAHTGSRQSLGFGGTVSKRQSMDERPMPGAEFKPAHAASGPGRSSSATGLRGSGQSGGYPAGNSRGGSLTTSVGGGGSLTSPPGGGPRSSSATGLRNSSANNPGSPQKKPSMKSLGASTKMRASQSGGAWR
mmetsp:Transcript_93013/g.164453  ORF Transcript_93013/g.164453 Transcript_93013/m.164453 type:complete len:502 (-) Transcript_93013:62-1567(-)